MRNAGQSHGMNSIPAPHAKTASTANNGNVKLVRRIMGSAEYKSSKRNKHHQLLADTIRYLHKSPPYT